jgi:hypothetical protein
MLSNLGIVRSNLPFMLSNNMNEKKLTLELTKFVRSNLPFMLSNLGIVRSNLPFMLSNLVIVRSNQLRMLCTADFADAVRM